MSYSFRATKRDEDAIAIIRLDRGGISVSDAIRVALHECAYQKPQLAIIASMAPPKDFAAFKTTVVTFSEDLIYVAETGLPKSTPDTAPEDLPIIEKARAKFHAAYAKVDEIVLKVELFSRLIAALAVCDIHVLRKAMAYQQRQHESQARLALDPKLPIDRRRVAENWVRESSGPVLQLFRAVGIQPAVPKIQKPTSTDNVGAA